MGSLERLPIDLGAWWHDFPHPVTRQRTAQHTMTTIAMARKISPKAEPHRLTNASSPWSTDCPNCSDAGRTCKPRAVELKVEIGQSLHPTSTSDSIPERASCTRGGVFARGDTSDADDPVSDGCAEVRMSRTSDEGSHGRVHGAVDPAHARPSELVDWMAAAVKPEVELTLFGERGNVVIEGFVVGKGHGGSRGTRYPGPELPCPR